MYFVRFYHKTRRKWYKRHVAGAQVARKALRLLEAEPYVLTPEIGFENA